MKCKVVCIQARIQLELVATTSARCLMAQRLSTSQEASFFHCNDSIKHSFQVAPPTIISASHYDTSDKPRYHHTMPLPVSFTSLHHPPPSFLTVRYPLLFVFYLPALTLISHFQPPHPLPPPSLLLPSSSPSTSSAVLYLILNSGSRGPCLLSPSS